MPDRREPPGTPDEPTAPLAPQPTAPLPSQPDSVWARPDTDATQGSPQPDWSALDGWGQQPSQGSPPGVEARPDLGPQPSWSATEGWGQQPDPGLRAGWERWPAAGAPRGWRPPAAPRRGPGRNPLLVGAGIALLLVVAVLAVPGLRGSSGQRTASPGTVAPLAPGGGGRGTGGGATPGGGTSGGGGGALGAGPLRLPDQVGGLARIPLGDPSLAQGQQGLLDLITRSGALDGWALGAYGPNRDDPRFVFMVIRSEEAETAGLIAGGLIGGVRDNLGGDLSDPRRFTRNNVRYDCFNGSLGGICSFREGATFGIGFGRDTDLDRLSQLTDEARRGVRS